jgi:hypothetical protein
MYSIFMYEYNIEIVLRRGRGDEGALMEGVNLIKTHFKHICKCDNDIPLYN